MKWRCALSPRRTDLKRHHEPPEYLAVNPMGKMPAMWCADKGVTEGVANCTYLADALPHARWHLWCGPL
ncbi:hypothetical protein [Bordetella sp. FB-8]|uniref:hypothetical protein n=1 Tax=Bordetella sp. FB-8 TaxID=1159870 RepID=UPI0012DD65D0